jgi:hypothetical protein
MKPILLYVAGPMRGLPQFNFPAFDDAAAQLREAGYEVINPAEVDRALGFDPTDPHAKTFTEDDYHAAMRRDIPLVMKANGVALLHGWRDSRGANIEHDIAKAIGNQAMMVEAWLHAAAKERTRIARK